MGGLKENSTKDSKFKYKGLMRLIAGVDEVGRGSLVGPVYAAAVILNKSINKKLLKDSKKLTKKKGKFYQSTLNKTLYGPSVKLQ